MFVFNLTKNFLTKLQIVIITTGFLALMKHFDVPIKATRHSILLFRKSFESLLAIPGSDVRVWRQVVTFLFLTH